MVLLKQLINIPILCNPELLLLTITSDMTAKVIGYIAKGAELKTTAKLAGRLVNELSGPANNNQIVKVDNNDSTLILEDTHITVEGYKAH